MRCHFLLLAVVLSTPICTIIGTTQPVPVRAEPEASRGSAQDPGGIGPGLSVPRLIKFGGALKTPSGSPLTGVHGVTLALYKEQQGGAPVWMESQNVELDQLGRYTVLLGATKSGGVPLELFMAGEPRWLGIQVQLPGYQEEARVLLVSVPYALKAADAERLGGKPLSAFVMVPEEAAKSDITGQLADRTPGVVHSSRAISLPTAAVTTANYIAMFLDGSGTVGDSTIFQSGGNVGIGTTTPGAKLQVNGPVYLDAEGSGIVVDAAGFKRMGFMKYAGLEAAFTRFSGTGLRFGRTASLDVTAGTAGNFTLEMLITGTGNVGIGTPTPSAKLEVAGNVLVSGGGVISGNGSGLTSLNADNLSAGQIANARTTADSANTPSAIVARDGSGNFSAGAITATSFSGNGAALTSLNGANLTAGSVTTDRTTATSSNTFSRIVARDASGRFAATGITLSDTAATAFFATATSTAANIHAIRGDAPVGNIAILGFAGGTPISDFDGDAGVVGVNSSATGQGVLGSNSSSGTGVYGSSSSGNGIEGTSSSGLAGKFTGGVEVTGKLSVGVPPASDTIALVGQTAAIGTTTIYAHAGPVAQYRVSVYAYTYTAGDAVNLTFTIGWTDPVSQAHTKTSANIPINTLGAYDQAVFTLIAGLSTNITYSTSLSGGIGAGSYTIRIKLEKL